MNVFDRMMIVDDSLACSHRFAAMSPMFVVRMVVDSHRYFDLKILENESAVHSMMSFDFLL